MQLSTYKDKKKKEFLNTGLARIFLSFIYLLSFVFFEFLGCMVAS